MLYNIVLKHIYCETLGAYLEKLYFCIVIFS